MPALFTFKMRFIFNYIRKGGIENEEAVACVSTLSPLPGLTRTGGETCSDCDMGLSGKKARW